MAKFEEFMIYSEKVFVLNGEIVSSVAAKINTDSGVYRYTGETSIVHAVKDGGGYAFHFPVSPKGISRHDLWAYGLNRKGPCVLCYSGKPKEVHAERLRRDDEYDRRLKEQEKNTWKEGGWSFLASDSAPSAPPRLRKAERRS